MRIIFSISGAVIVLFYWRSARAVEFPWLRM